MISLCNAEELKGSIIRVKRTASKREPYSIVGELRMITNKRIIIDGSRSGTTHKIPMERIISICQVEPEFKILYFSQDGLETASGLKKKE